MTNTNYVAISDTRRPSRDFDPVRFPVFEPIAAILILTLPSIFASDWETWVTEDDFASWARAGLNHVRLPIGYWALDIKQGEPWVSGSWEYVIKAAEWCKKYNLQLMVDLHGAPGSQNGNDHSGHAGSIGFYYDDENLQRAANVIGQIAQWANATEWRNTVSIIQLLNEPVLWDDYNYRLQRLKDYYRMAYDEVGRRICKVAIFASLLKIFAYPGTTVQ